MKYKPETLNAGGTLTTLLIIFGPLRLPKFTGVTTPFRVSWWKRAKRFIRKWRIYDVKIRLVFAMFVIALLSSVASAQTKYTSTNQYQCSKNLLTNTFACTQGYMTMYDQAGQGASVYFSTPHLFIMDVPYRLYLNGTQITSYTLTGPSGTHPGTFSYNWTGCTSEGACYSGTGLVMWVNGPKSFQALTTYEELVIDSGSTHADGTCPDKQCCPNGLPQCKPIESKPIATAPFCQNQCSTDPVTHNTRCYWVCTYARKDPLRTLAYTIPPQCIYSATLVDCENSDFKGCRANLTWNQGCEQIQARKPEEKRK